MSFFFVEMCLKLFALTPKEYFSSKFNTFDFIVSYCLFFFHQTNGQPCKDMQRVCL